MEKGSGMKKFLKKFPDAAKRILIVFILVIGAVVLIRFLIPPSLIETELHVESTIEREIAKEVRYAGADVCADCHDQSDVQRDGYHRNLSCETCHGAAWEHAENPLEIKPVPPMKREFCSLCHAYSPSRPSGFPQINPVAHNPLKQCVTCHDPHDPKPPTVPRDCEACHAEIARTKSVSPHVQLDCTTCHKVSVEHKTTPRLVRATIPSERAFCGKCHDDGSQVEETPKVDLSTHGEKYLCWQCHYPHMPEVR